jgi:radical SAM protein with 4Fe4S-binding SPASM domain
VSKLLSYARIFFDWRIRPTADVGYVPEDISIELTNTCNFKCSFCPQSDPRHFEIVDRTLLTPEQAETLLKRLREGGVTTDVLHLTLDGEPFVNPKIDRICELAVQYGFKRFIFATNGFYVTPERVARLPGAERGVTYTLSIDFCADRTLFETHRGTKNSWEKVRDNIRAVLADPTKAHVSVFCTDISSFAIDDRAVLARNLADLKALFPGSDRIRVGSRIFHNATGFVSGIKETKQAQAGRYNLCPYPWTSMVIASNGDVVACCRDLDHKTVLGNLFEEDLVSIWTGPRYREMRQALIDRQPDRMAACQGCDLPYDQGKFTLRHLIRTGIDRLGIFG